MRAVRCLDCNHKALVILVRDSVLILRRGRTCLVIGPDWKILQVLVRYIGVRCVVWVGEDLLLLSLKLFNESVELALQLAELLLIFAHLFVPSLLFPIQGLELLRHTRIRFLVRSLAIGSRLLGQSFILLI